MSARRSVLDEVGDGLFAELDFIQEASAFPEVKFLTLLHMPG